MKIRTRNEEGVTIIDLQGKLTIGEGDIALREAVDGALRADAKKLLINLRGVGSMDSAGLGELVRTKATAARHGASIKLVHVEDKVAEVLQMTQLIGVFDTYDDEIDAIASFRA